MKNILKIIVGFLVTGVLYVGYMVENLHAEISAIGLWGLDRIGIVSGPEISKISVYESFLKA